MVYRYSMSKERQGMVAISMRLPVGLYRKIFAIRKRKPYMSMNAIIIEELVRELGKGEPAKKEVV